MQRNVQPLKVQRHGFTLVELLVVIAIISVLAALLLPALERAVNQAQVVACKSQMKQQYLSLSVYGADFDDYLPDSPNSGLSTDTAWKNDSLPLKGDAYLRGIGKLVPYLDDRIDILCCPSRTPENKKYWARIAATNYTGGTWSTWGPGTNFIIQYATGWNYGEGWTGGTWSFKPLVFSSYINTALNKPCNPRLLKPTLENYARRCNFPYQSRQVLMADSSKIHTDGPFRASFHNNGEIQNTLMVDGTVKQIVDYWSILYPKLPSYATTGEYWHVGNLTLYWWTTFGEGEHCY